MNQLPCSASAARIALISGNDAIPFDVTLLVPPLQPVDLTYVQGMEDSGLIPPGMTAEVAASQQPAELLVHLFNLGTLANTGPSDGVVPVWSAQGKDRDGIALSPFVGLDDERLRVPSPSPFNHLEVGTENQPLGAILEESILPTLTDWYTTTQTEPTTDMVDPEGEPGDRIRRARTQVEWFSASARYTGFALVVYGKDSQGDWHLLGGADPESGELDEVGFSTDGAPNSNTVEAEDKRLDEVRYHRPTTISWTETKMIAIALPYRDPESDDPERENVLPIDRLPRVAFESAVR